MGHGADAAAEQRRPRVFISYAHDDDAHIEQVETLYELLRKKGGVDAQLDMYAGARPQDWAHWMEQQCAEADYTLVIASPKYKLRAEHEEQDGAGLGVAWEARLLRTWIYENHKTWFEKVLLVVLPGRSAHELPGFFGAPRMSRFDVATLNAAGIEELVRYMWKQPYRIEPEIGPIPVYTPRPPLVLDDASGSSGTTEPDAPEVGGAATGSGGLDETDWQQLARLLGGVPPESWAEQAYQWSFGATGSTSQAAAPFHLPDGDLYDWAWDLGRRRHVPGTLPKPVTFAHALAVGYAAGESPADRLRARRLHAWADHFMSHHSLPPPPTPRIERTEATLTVRLVEHAQRPDVFYAEVWLRTMDGRRPRRLQPPPSSASLTADLEGVRLLLENCMRDLAEAFGIGGRAAAPRLQRIEFAVSDRLLEETFDQWRVRLRREERVLGKMYEVVVRCLDQRGGVDLAGRWAGRWRWLTRQGGGDERAMVWVEDEHADCLDDLVGEWSETDHPVCVGVSMKQAQHGVAAALDAAMPVVVWQREEHRNDPSVPPLRSLLEIGDTSQLPLLVWKLRRDRRRPARERSSVVLLWDDPDHSMTPQPLSDANLIA